MTLDIKRLIIEDYIIICDTNVYLHIYRYSPEFSDFALRCIQAVRSAITLPSTVKYEFSKHHKAYFGKMEKRVRGVGNDAKMQINNAAQKVLKVCDNLQTLQYPDVAELRSGLSDKFNELIAIAETYFEDRTILNFIANPWNGKNLVCELIEQITADSHIMETVTQEEIYRACEEGEKRYSSTPPIPPGFKDKQAKDGVRKYSDLIIWREILRYSKANDVNVIFVTDDVKSDWWTDDGGQRVFHPHLFAEFARETSKVIVPMTSLEFFTNISVCYNIPQTDAVEIALRLTDTDYFERIYEEVFDEITSALAYSGDEYIDPSSHLGTNGIEELEITDYEFIFAEQFERNQDTIRYVFTFRVEAEAISYDFWGKDEETKSIVLEPAGSHTFEGEIHVEVVREAGMYLDFEANNGFESAKILEGKLIETSFTPLFGEEDLEGAYDTCPDCGCQINYNNDGGNGFCTICALNH